MNILFLNTFAVAIPWCSKDPQEFWRTDFRLPEGPGNGSNGSEETGRERERENGWGDTPVGRRFMASIHLAERLGPGGVIPSHKA